MSKPKQCCLTCSFADYLKTPTGRLVRGETIRCNFPTRDLYEAVREVIAQSPASMRSSYLRIAKCGMEADDGQDCKQWEPAR